MMHKKGLVYGSLRYMYDHMQTQCKLRCAFLEAAKSAVPSGANADWVPPEGRDVFVPAFDNVLLANTFPLAQ